MSRSSMKLAPIGRAGLVALMLCAGLPARSAARPEDRAQAEIFDGLTVLIGSDEISGQVQLDPSAEDNQVEARLLAPEGWTRASTIRLPGEDGSVELRFESRGGQAFSPQRIWPGDRLALSLKSSAATRSMTLTVPTLSVDVEPETRRVTGRAPAGARVYLTAFDAAGDFARSQATASETGDFSAVVDAALTLGPGASGSALILEGATAYQVAWALPAPRLRIGSAEVTLQVRPGESVGAQLLDGEGRALASAKGFGRGGQLGLQLRDARGSLQPVLPGHRLRLSFDTGDPSGSNPSPPIQIDVPALVAELDPVAGQVAGQTWPGQRLLLDTGAEQIEARADPRYGFFRADLPTIDAASGLRLSFLDVPQVEAQILAPSLDTRDPRLAWVQGSGQAGARARLTLSKATGEMRGQAALRIGPDGRFGLGLPSPSGLDTDRSLLPLEPGDRLSLSIEGYDARRGWRVWRETSLIHAPLEAAADSGADRVGGRSAPGEALSVTLGRTKTRLAVVAGADGSWLADFRGLADLRAGEPIEIEARDPGSGARRKLAFRAFRASPQANGERVRIEGHAGLTAEVELERDARLIGWGRCEISAGQDACETRLLDASGQAVWLEGEDLIVASAEGLGTAAVDTVTMSAHIDANGRDVVGVAPVDDSVEIRFMNEQGDGLPLDTSAGTDENGVYDHELAASEWDQLVPGLVAEVSYARPRGHRQIARAVIEQLRLGLGRAELQVLAEPGTRVTATLESACTGAPEPGDCGRAVIERDAARVPGDGRPALRLAALAGPLAPGSRLRLEHSRGEILLPLTAFSAWPLDESGALAGQGPAFARIRAYHHLSPGADAAWLAVTGEIGADGLFQLPAPAVDPSAVESIELVLYLGRGAELSLTIDRSLKRARIHLPLAWR